jgi:hypothetical protein
VSPWVDLLGTLVAVAGLFVMAFLLKETLTIHFLRKALQEFARGQESARVPGLMDEKP